MYRTTVYLPVKLIKKANEENWLRSLAYLAKLKAAYKNPTFFNFSLRKVAASIKCSPSCLLHHLQILEKHGLVRFHSGNLTVTGYRALEKLFNTRRFIGITVDEKNQYDILRSLLIKFNLQRQEYGMRKNGRKICTNLTARTNSLDNYVGLSCKGIGRLYRLSKETGSRLRRKLERMGVIHCEPMYRIVLMSVNYSDFCYLRNNFEIPQHSFYQNGTVLARTRTRILWGA